MTALTPWPPTRVALLARLREVNGLSFSAIALKMGTTKNAVLGRYWRTTGDVVGKREQQRLTEAEWRERDTSRRERAAQEARRLVVRKTLPSRHYRPFQDESAN